VVFSFHGRGAVANAVGRTSSKYQLRRKDEPTGKRSLMGLRRLDPPEGASSSRTRHRQRCKQFAHIEGRENARLHAAVGVLTALTLVLSARRCDLDHAQFNWMEPHLPKT